MELTEKILLYQQGAWTWDDIWNDLQVVIIKSVDYEIRDNSATSQFLDKMHSRCQSMAGVFAYHGKLFEAYLSVHVKYALRSFKKAAKTRILREISYQNLSVRSHGEPDGMCCADSAQSKYYCNVDLPFDFASVSTESRRVVLTALKNPFCLNDSLIQTIARQCAVPASWLFCRCEELKEGLQRKLIIKQKIEGQLAAIQMQLEVAGIDDTLRLRLQATRNRLQERWKQTRLFPHHRDMAACLQIPKGTIDSSFYYLRQLALRADQHSKNSVALAHDSTSQQKQKARSIDYF